MTALTPGEPKPSSNSLQPTMPAAVGNATRTPQFSLNSGSARKRDAVGQNPAAALGFHFSQQRRLFFRRPLPAARNHNLPIHSNHSFWPVQKDSASFRILLSATLSRTVHTGRLRKSGSARN
jgi:hypothetical protein